MKVLTSVERFAYKDGVQHGEALMLMNQIKYKFKEIPENYIEKINSADARTLEQWGINFILANSLDEIFKNN